MKKWRGVLVITAIAAGILCLMTTEKSTSSILINEVCSRNATLIDEQYFGEDYIELYNTTNKPLSLRGWFLSDDSENLDKQSLPDITIEPKGFYVFYADGIGERLDSLAFKISQDGERLFLSSPQGEVVDQVYVPAMDVNNVYARRKDGNAEWQVLEASVGMTNNDAREAVQVTLNPPVLSHQSGFYEEEFILTMRADKGTTIYYTTDGSTPTKESNVYKEGILIRNNTDQKNVINAVQNIVADWKDYEVLQEKADKGMVIRAIAMDGKNYISEVVTATYLVGLDRYKDCKVISVTADPEKLIGDNGIFVTGPQYDAWYIDSDMAKDGAFEIGFTTNYETTNFWLSSRQNEVLGNVQIFENGEEYLNQKTSFRVQGAFNRTKDKKSLQLFARGVYTGDSLFDKPVFEKASSHALYITAAPEKAYFLKLAEDRNLSVQQAEPCVLFLNGEYWYTAALMEKYDETYFSEHFGVNPENVLYVKDRVSTIGEDYAYLYDDLVDYLRDESVTQEAKSEVLYEVFDVQSFIDWTLFNLYLGNDDVSYKKNSTVWRTIEPDGSMYGDCKWRWMIFDVDHAAMGFPAELTDFWETSLINSNRFYWAFKTSEHFRRQFVLTAMDMMNTTFLPENVEEVLAEWGQDLSYGDSYFIKRPEYMKQGLVNEFSLSGIRADVELNINDTEAGTVYINTIQPQMTDGSWTGEYFIDYPVTVTASANPGYRFVGWSGNSAATDTTIEVAVTEGGISLTAIFEKE